MDSKTWAKALMLIILLFGSNKPAKASVFINPIYKENQLWNGNARVSFWNDGKQVVVINYPVLKGCYEAKKYMISAMAGNPRAGLLGRHEFMGLIEVNELISELSNSPTLGFKKLSQSRSASPDFWTQLKAFPYPSMPFDCGRNSKNRFSDWR